MVYSSNTRQSIFELLMSQDRMKSKMRVLFILKFGEFDFVLDKIVLASLLFIICTLLKI